MINREMAVENKDIALKRPNLKLYFLFRHVTAFPEVGKFNGHYKPFLHLLPELHGSVYGRNSSSSGSRKVTSHKFICTNTGAEPANPLFPDANKRGPYVSSLFLSTSVLTAFAISTAP